MVFFSVEAIIGVVRGPHWEQGVGTHWSFMEEWRCNELESALAPVAEP